MTWFTAILVFVIIWWLVFFMLLPMGASSYHETGTRVETGNAESAPLRPRIRLKALIATAAATLVTIPTWYLVDSGLLSFRP